MSPAVVTQSPYDPTYQAFLATLVALHFTPVSITHLKWGLGACSLCIFFVSRIDQVILKKKIDADGSHPPTDEEYSNLFVEDFGCHDWPHIRSVVVWNVKVKAGAVIPLGHPTRAKIYPIAPQIVFVFVKLYLFLSNRICICNFLSSHSLQNLSHRTSKCCMAMKNAYIYALLLQ